MSNIDETYNRWLDNADESLQAELEAMDEHEKNECFGTYLSFGTAGLRGFLRAGTNGMNIHTVAAATQGLANYLNKNFKNPSVAIARDSRNKGEEFVKVCVGVLAANGVVAHYHEDVESTPGLSFTVRELHCSAGICVTASHNPAEYNGYKVYGPDGCQITSEAAASISKEINSLDIFEDVNILNFEDAKSGDYANVVDATVREAFITACCDCSVSFDNDIKIVYTALHGTGYPEVMEALHRNNFEDIVPVTEQAEPNGDFPTCPYPNPETADALALGLKYCEEHDADLLIATDPDADRVGVALKHNGGYTRLNGNEIGVLLLNYLCEANENLDDKVCVTTIVSSDLVDAIAKHYGVELRRTLTGFKYIGEQILHLEEADARERFMFGFEESCGYLPGTHVRDKDGISACLLIAQMAAMYKKQGRDLVDVLEDLYKQFGFYKNDQIAVEYPGLEGADKMASVLANIRRNNPKTFAGLKVLGCKDYEEDTRMLVIGDRDDTPDELLPKSNVLEFPLEGGSKIIVRPSGTEPKIKVYCFGLGKTEADAQKIMDSLKSSVKELLA
ncbi:MAG: phospho-sugar mutase [Coriobacteriia bacterium]|nr:phospho-sugar mutase [Coriobacteriia bacterium]